MLSCKFWDIFKSTLFTEHLQAIVSEHNQISAINNQHFHVIYFKLCNVSKNNFQIVTGDHTFKLSNFSLRRNGLSLIKTGSTSKIVRISESQTNIAEPDRIVLRLSCLIYQYGHFTSSILINIIEFLIVSISTFSERYWPNHQPIPCEPNYQNI